MIRAPKKNGVQVRRAAFVWLALRAMAVLAPLKVCVGFSTSRDFLQGCDLTCHKSVIPS